MSSILEKLLKERMKLKLEELKHKYEEKLASAKDERERLKYEILLEYINETIKDLEG